ncbi:MAG: hypothetical protein H0T57_01215 [Rubrobacter sp.]|nr:hypothetical protein [Rubrobacter sp.]
MGWEKRERGGLYYTRSKKIDGRVMREYVGGGSLGKLAAEADALERRRREEEAEAQRAEQELLEGLEAPVRKLCEITEALAHTALLAAGYHRHNRGEWRKRRVSPKKKNTTAKTPAKKDEAAIQKYLETEEGIFELLRQAERGDKTVLPALREALDRGGPELVNLWGDLARKAEWSLLGVMAGENLLLKEAVPRKLEAMREDLAGPSPTPLERLLVERVVACWLQLEYADMIYAHHLPDLTMARSEYHQRRLDRLHKRYLSAIRTLAQIRKLGPVVQINVAEQQVNMMGQ